MSVQLSLFDLLAPPRVDRPSGWRVHHPCACGRTHAMLFVAHPYCMLSLRHWGVSRASAHTAAMMAERHAADNGRPVAREVAL